MRVPNYNIVYTYNARVQHNNHDMKPEVLSKSRLNKI